ncbi:MAG: hypothetical protein NVS3B20_23120 [Polyangiales bacterium]
MCFDYLAEGSDAGADEADDPGTAGTDGTSDLGAWLEGIGEVDSTEGALAGKVGEGTAGAEVIDECAEEGVAEVLGAVEAGPP